MSVKMIQQRLASYNCRTDIEEQQAIREISQEVVLASLGRSDFFKHALFQGGTCLRKGECAAICGALPRPATALRS